MEQEDSDVDIDSVDDVDIDVEKSVEDVDIPVNVEECEDEWQPPPLLEPVIGNNDDNVEMELDQNNNNDEVQNKYQNL